MRFLSARMYAYFLLVALTVALPPTIMLTLPSIALIAWMGHRSRRASRQRHSWKAHEQHRRSVMAAMRSL